MVELRDLLVQPRLGLQLRACTDARDTPVRWARIIEDQDDVAACTGSELILTRGRWRRRAADADRFVCGLTQRGVAALAYQPGGTAALLDELVAACERWRLPLLVVPPAVAVDEVAESTITAALHRHNAGALRTQARHRALVGLIGEPNAVPRLLAMLAEDLACPISLLLAAGAVPAAGGAQLSDADVAALAETVSGRRGTVELLAEDGTPLSAIPVGAPSQSPLAHIIAAVPAAELTTDDREALDQVRQVLERQLVLMRRRRDAQRPMSDEFLRRATTGDAAGSELAAWARALGVNTDGHVVCLIAQAPDATPEDVTRIADGLDQIAELDGVPHVVATDDHEVCAVLFAGTVSDRVDQDVARATSALRPFLSRLSGALGHSSLIARGHGDITRVVHEARRVCQLNSLREPDPVRTDVRPDAPLSALLLMSNDDAVRSLHDLMLAPLLEYDEEHGSELVRTLDVFLSTGGQWSASAAELGVHVNTLRYRLTRIEKCTGRDPAAMADRVDFYVALRAREARGAPGAARTVLSSMRTD